jgi:hypothetical protein
MMGDAQVATSYFAGTVELIAEPVTYPSAVGGLVGSMFS